VVEDQTGVVHLVWQEPYDFFAPEKGSIVYSRGTEQANGKMYWTPTTNPISGQIAGANGTDPLNLVSDIVQWGNCAVTYFHGTLVGGIDNEIVWGVDSCSGWSESLRDQVTTDSVRSINPNLNVQNNWWLYLAYEQGTGTSARQIYLQRTKPDLYLPVVFK
ncbi:MAG: hypothetical protein P8183_16570, partial [Anaerolineae bacterium]